MRLFYLNLEKLSTQGIGTDASRFRAALGEPPASA